MKILLLGGTGTLSYEVLKNSLEKGYDVSILNRGNNNTHLNNIKTYIADLKCTDTIEKVLKEDSFDVIVDFFSRVRQDINNLFPILSKRCKQYIFISSACVYCRDNVNKTPITEITQKPNPLWDYNIHKYEAEQALINLANNSSTYYTIVRPYITYNNARIPLGLTPSYRYHRTIIERIRSGKPMFLWDDGGVYCTLTYNTDFAKALTGLYLNPKAKNEDFHITSDFRYTWKEVLLTIYKELNQTPNFINIPTAKIIKSLPEYKGELIGDRSLNAIFNNKKIKEAVPNIEFKTSLNEGIKKILSFYENNTKYEYDYKYDARIDKLLSISGVKNLHYIPYPNCDKKSRILYNLYRYLPLKIANRLVFIAK